MEDRLKWKLKIVKGLYEQGYDREDILELFRFIDWVMTLPATLENQFDDELSAFEEEREMPYVTSVERRAALRTRQSSIIDALEVRFGPVPEEITEQVARLHDADQLQALFKDAILVESRAIGILCKRSKIQQNQEIATWSARRKNPIELMSFSTS